VGISVRQCPLIVPGRCDGDDYALPPSADIWTRVARPSPTRRPALRGRKRPQWRSTAVPARAIAP